MSARPSRSSSIPIPRNSSASSSSRNIESLMSIPLTSPGRHSQFTPSNQNQRSLAESPRRAGISHGSRPVAGGSNTVFTSSFNSPMRSMSLASTAPGRITTQTPFEPTVIRSVATDVTALDPECSIEPSTSHSHTRRPSLAANRASNSQKPFVPQHVVNRTTAVAFPMPSYLGCSSLRHLLQTESPSLPIPSRRIDPPGGSRPPLYPPAMSPPSDNDDDSTASPPPAALPPPEPSFVLPIRWSDQDRHQGLSLSPEGRDLTYNGGSCTDKDAAAARTANPLPPACGIYYFEVEILGKEQKAHISIGFAGRSVKFSRLPGWEANSWGYYGDDRCSLTSERSGVQYGLPFGAGDTIGCGIDFTTFKVFYTRNGTLIGTAFENVGRGIEIYPTVGIQHTGDAIRANFGQDLFRYDIDCHVQQQRDATWNKILGFPLSRKLLTSDSHKGAGSIALINHGSGTKTSLSDAESKVVLNQLVQSYLIHHGYAKTARAFEKQQGGFNKEIAGSIGGLDSTGDRDVDMHTMSNGGGGDQGDIEHRTGIVNFILAGQVDSAINELRHHYPIVLDIDDHLMLFKLRCRKFVELILETSEMKKRMKKLKERGSSGWKGLPEDDWMDEEMSMDIDDDVSSPSFATSNRAFDISHHNPIGGDEMDLPEITSDQYEAALSAAIAYGQGLSNDCHSDPRPDLQRLFKRTFGIVAWEDPTEAEGPVADIAGHDSRIALAHEVNEAILKSQGLPPQPALETAYRHTAATVLQLGLMGVGAAAFADMSREFLQ